jgi:hypothetical protein
VFTDEFPEQSAAVSIGVLARHFSRAWLVVVTRHRARFEELLAEINTGALDRLFILPRPVWGWALLDHVMQPPPLPLDP